MPINQSPDPPPGVRGFPVAWLGSGCALAIGLGLAMAIMHMHMARGRARPAFPPPPGWAPARAIPFNVPAFTAASPFAHWNSFPAPPLPRRYRCFADAHVPMMPRCPAPPLLLYPGSMCMAVGSQLPSYPHPQTRSGPPGCTKNANDFFCRFGRKSHLSWAMLVSAVLPTCRFPRNRCT